ncbi:hypothetical protein G7046_g1736 [Stylonectria norvegica]|nr:hypothetical protein G7046_g1736 [Stylonectria norvegica]
MVRITLKQLLPLALLLTTSVIAQKETKSTDVATTTATDATETATQTAKDDATTTEVTTTATGDDKSSDDKTTKDDKKSGKDSSKTTSEKASTVKGGYTYTPTIPATVAPDINAGVSLRDPGFVGLTVAFGIMTIGMAFL